MLYHCDIQKSDKQDFYSIIQTLTKMLINRDRRQKYVVLLCSLLSTLTTTRSFG